MSGAGTLVLGLYPFFSAAAELITLKIDPGGYVWLSARLSSGLMSASFAGQICNGGVVVRGCESAYDFHAPFR